MKSSKSLSTALKLLVTAIFLLLVFRSVDISKIQNDLQAFNVWYLIFLLFVSWVGQFICSQRWRLIAATLEIRSSYRSFVQMYFVGMFFNIGLPSIIGGDVIKACILSRKTGRTLPIALSSILQDRTAGLISLFILGNYCYCSVAGSERRKVLQKIFAS